MIQDNDKTTVPITEEISMQTTTMDSDSIQAATSPEIGIAGLEEETGMRYDTNDNASVENHLTIITARFSQATMYQIFGSSHFLLLFCCLAFLPMCFAFPGLDHEFIPPKSIMERSQCPGLNTLANHGFISRNGMDVSLNQVLEAGTSVYGYAPDFMADVLEKLKEKGFSPTPVINPGTGLVEDEVFNLVDLYDKGDIKHKLEHNASLFRQDPTESDPFPQFDKFLFDGMIAEQKAYDMGQDNVNITTHITWEGAGRHVTNRIQYSRKNNPAYNDLSNKELLSAMLRDLFFLFSAVSDDPTLETISIANLQSFVELNRIPEGFVPRQELGLPLLVEDDMTQLLRYFRPVITRADASSTITASECMMGMASLQLDLGEFRHYDKWFRHNTRLVLPQAGEYVGPKDIAEYIMFAYDKSPYVLERDNPVVTPPRLKSINQVDGICTFVSMVSARARMNPDVTRDATVRSAIMRKIEYNFHENYVENMYVIFPDDWYRFFFGTLLNTENVKKFICSVSENSCPETNVGMGVEECMQKLDELPSLTDNAWFDGNDFGCRAMHAVFAASNKDHCAHISFEAQLDPKNRTKCQVSKEYHKEDYFDDDDLEDFREFFESDQSLIESTDGFKILSLKPEKSTEYYVLLGLVVPLVFVFVAFFALRQSEQASKVETSKNRPSDASNPVFADNHRRLRYIIISTFSFLVLVNGSAAVLIWAIARNHLKWEWEDYDDKWKDTYAGPAGVVLESVPHALMTDSQYRVYVGFIIWVTVILAGLGLEIFVWYYFLQVWCSWREAFWRFANFIFPLLMMTSLGLASHQNFLALPIVVVGLWKLGFPETFMYLYLGLFSPTNSKVKRAADYLNGVGTVLHHGAASMIISMLTAAVAPPSRYILNGAIILVIQHWVTLLADFNAPLYSAIELGLEYYFEWIVLSDFGQIYSAHWTYALGAGVMIFAHWVYLIAALLEMFAGNDYDKKEKEECVHQRGAKLLSTPFGKDIPGTTTVNDNRTSSSGSLQRRRSARRQTSKRASCFSGSVGAFDSSNLLHASVDESIVRLVSSQRLDLGTSDRSYKRVQRSLRAMQANCHSTKQGSMALADQFFMLQLNEISESYDDDKFGTTLPETSEISSSAVVVKGAENNDVVASGILDDHGMPNGNDDTDASGRIVTEQNELSDVIEYA